MLGSALASPFHGPCIEVLKLTRLDIVQATIKKDYSDLAKWPSPQEAPLLFRCYSHVVSNSFKSTAKEGTAVVPFLELDPHSADPNSKHEPLIDVIPEAPGSTFLEIVWVIKNMEPLQPGEMVTVSKAEQHR